MAHIEWSGESLLYVENLLDCCTRNKEKGKHLLVAFKTIFEDVIKAPETKVIVFEL